MKRIFFALAAALSLLVSCGKEKPEEVRQDEEGMQVMRELGRNMAWLLKCIKAGQNAGIEPPVKETPVKTNFIRP